MRADDPRLHRFCRLASIVVIAVGAYLRLRSAWTELAPLSRSALSDDAFSLFAIARHLSLGHPPSVDGVHPTDHYSPLWVGLLTLVFRLFGRTELHRPIHVALTLGALLDVGCAVVLDRIGGKLRLSAPARLVVVVLFSWNSFAILSATSGLSTSLALLAALFLVDASVAPVSQRSSSPIIFGLLGGLAALARIDLLVVFAVLVARRAVIEGGRGARRRVDPGASQGVPTSMRRAATGAATSFLVALFVLTPWLVYCVRTTGTLPPFGELAPDVVVDRIPAVWGVEQATVSLGARRFVGAGVEAIAIIVRALGVGSAAIVVVIAVIFVVVTFARGQARKLLLGRFRRLGWPLGALLALAILQVLSRMVFRLADAAPLVAAFVLVIGVLADHLFSSLRSSEVAAGSVVALSTLCLGREAFAQRKNELHAEASIGAKHVVANEARTTCGAATYFAGTSVANLDGTFNQGALDAIRAHRLLDYVRREGFARLYIDARLRSEVHFGSRYREQLSADEDGDPGALRLVRDDTEKDALILLDRQEIDLATTAGRELLSDGWRWRDGIGAKEWASSLGGASEIVFTLPARRGPWAFVQLELRAAALDATGVQHVDVYLDAMRVLSLDLTKGASVSNIPVSNARPGRNRLRLVYRTPMLEQVSERLDWWRDPAAVEVRAVEARKILFVRSDEVRLPPEGPKLGDPEGDRILTSGFLPVERVAASAAVWAVGPRAEITFWLADASKRTLALVAGPPPASDGVADQTVSFELDGRPLGSMILRSGAVEVHELPIPDGALVIGQHHLVLHFARTAHDELAGIDRAAFVRAIDLR